MPMPDPVAVLVGAILFFLLGGLWYSPLLFARPWVRLAYPGRSMEDLRKEGARPAGYALAFVAGLVAVATVGFFAETLGGDLWAGARAGLYVAVGIVGTTFATTYFFAGKRPALYLIDAGYQMTGLALAGLVYGSWPW